MSQLSLLLILMLVVVGLQGKLKKAWPPHCTTVTKETDYISKFKFDYPLAYIPPGQHEAYQQMYCINPPTVNKAATTVCDWAAPPQVHFILTDDYLHIVRVDPTGRFQGNAVIKTVQQCQHNITTQLYNETGIPIQTSI